MDTTQLDLQREKPLTNRFQIESTLGSGGMGVVYLAQDLKLKRQVAIKKLHGNATSATAHARIQREAQLLAKLNHPNIVQLYDVLEEEGNIALVIEYVEGVSLKEWMREQTPKLQQKLILLMQICQGLSEAHALGIIHRDLKPDNILITHNRQPHTSEQTNLETLTAKITDFGIAKSQQTEEITLTQTEQVSGTVSAMSPEQIQGKALNSRSDLFSFGVIAYELLCGARPFANSTDNTLAMASRIVHEPHIPPEQNWAAIPEPLTALLNKLLSKDPIRRPESAQLVYQALELLYRRHLEVDETKEFTATLTSLFKPQQTNRRPPWWKVALGGISALTLIGVGYWSWEYFTRLKPQYIAVVPVSIKGNVRGEKNAKELTATMVRQALMDAVPQLKASSLVSFTPKEQDSEAWLQALHNKGVTDALAAHLNCAQTRCEIRLERLKPHTEQIAQQTSFTFLTDQRQQSQYQITNSVAGLFERRYLKNTDQQSLMAKKDYDAYLDIVSRLDSKNVQEKDLRTLEHLSLNYPNNLNIYRTHTWVAASLFILSNDSVYIRSGLTMLELAKASGIAETELLELEIWLNTYGKNKQQFEKLLVRFEALNRPSATLLSKYARLLYTQGNYKSGLQYAHQAAQLNPSADNLYLVAIIHVRIGNYRKAKDTLIQIISRFPEHWSSFSTLGSIEIEMGNFKNAEKIIKAIPKHLLSWRVLSNLGLAYFLQKKYSQALDTFQKVMESAPDDLRTLNLIAETQLMLGHSERAHKNFQQIKSLTEGRLGLESRIFYALALANLGDLSQAVPLAHKLLQDSPEDTDTNHAAAQIYTLAGEVRSANYYIEKLLKQGMGAEWFQLPVYQQLCNQNQVSERLSNSICN